MDTLDLKNHSRPGVLQKLAFASLLSLAALVFMGKPDQTSLQSMDSAYHARIALEMTEGNGLPKLPMRSQEHFEEGKTTFNDQPFPLLYLDGLIMRALGPSAFSARLLPSAFAVGCVGLTVWLGALLFNFEAGLAGGLILTLTPEFIRFGARFQLDPAMIFFILLSFIAWRKNRIWLAGIAAGFGLWMKTPVALLLFPAVTLALPLSRSFTWKSYRNLVLSAFIALGAGAGVWIVTARLGGWELAIDYWKRQVFGTALGGRGVVRDTNYFMGWEALRTFYIPWFWPLMASLALIAAGKRFREVGVALCLSAALVIFVLISCLKFKYFHYYLPMYPFLALLIAYPVRNLLNQGREGFSLFLIGTALLANTLLIITPIRLGPEPYPALTFFNAIIQSHGTCTDTVLYLNGGQPYGATQDYLAEVQFYTHRRILPADCESAAGLIRKWKPEWIIATGSNREKCIPGDLRKPYANGYDFGNQTLFSRILPAESLRDLTPLDRMKKVVTDCTPPPFTRDEFHSY